MTDSMNLGQPDHYLFIIDTDSYAGRFEREMCAYITGQVDESRQGRENAELAKKEISDLVATLEDLVEFVPDTHGIAKPVTIFSNPTYKGQDYSVAIFFNSIPDHDLVEVMKQRAREFPIKGFNFADELLASTGLSPRGYTLKIEGFRLLEQHTVYKELPL